MRITVNIFRYSGIFGILLYLIFTLVSYRLYAMPFSPSMNWLSDLGNPIVNPVGAYFYNAGCIICSFLSVVFYSGLSRWHSVSRKNKTPILIAQIAGVFSALALLITALFPLGSYTEIHSFWSIMLYTGIGVFELFFAIAAFKYLMIGKWTGYYGILVMLINFITLAGSIFEFYIGEWIAVALFFIYILIITFQYNRHIVKTFLTTKGTKHTKRKALKPILFRDF